MSDTHTPDVSNQDEPPGLIAFFTKTMLVLGPLAAGYGMAGKWIISIL